MKEKKLFIVFMGIALLCSTCSKEDPEIQIVEGIQLEALSEEEAAFWDAQEDVVLTSSDIILPNGLSVEEFMQDMDPDFINEWSKKSNFTNDNLGPEDSKNLLIAKMNTVALYLTKDSNFVYQGDPDNGIPHQNGLAYSYGQRNYKERLRPPSPYTTCIEEIYGLDCSGFIYHLFLGAKVDLNLPTWSEKQRKPSVLESAIKTAYPQMDKIIVRDTGKIEPSKFESGDIIYWLKVNEKGEKVAFHIGMVLKKKNGDLAIAQSNGHPKSRCQDNYGPKRGPRFVDLRIAIKPRSQNGFGDDYGVVRIDTEKMDSLTYNHCDLEMEVIGQYKYVTNDTSYTQDADIILGAVSTGSFSGNTYTGSYSEAVGTSVKITGNVEAVLDESRTKIDSFNWSEQLVHPSYTVNKVLKAKDISFSSTSSGFVFSIMGETVKDHIITLKDDQISNAGLSYSIKNYQSQFDSYILVEFYTE